MGNLTCSQHVSRVHDSSEVSSRLVPRDAVHSHRHTGRRKRTRLGIVSRLGTRGSPAAHRQEKTGVYRRKQRKRTTRPKLSSPVLLLLIKATCWSPRSNSQTDEHGLNHADPTHYRRRRSRAFILAGASLESTKTHAPWFRSFPPAEI